MKIFLCDLVHNQTEGTNQISGGQDFVVPLGIGSLAIHAKNELKDLVEVSLFKYPQELLNTLKQENPDVVGFSNYIWNQDINTKIASIIREKLPDTLTLMGGPSIRNDDAGTEKFLRENPYLDIYIPFEGERPFLEVLNSFASKGRNFLNDNTSHSGCAYLRNDELVYLRASQDGKVDDLASPYLSGVLDEFLEQGLIPLFETNRGCPFLCTFCAWGNVDLNKVRKFSIDRVYAEMDYVAQNFPNLSSWIIADANFGMLSRDVEIAKKIKGIKCRTPALKHILIWESKNTSKRNLEIARIMGIDLGEVLMAVQTLDEDSQIAIKRDNISLKGVPEKMEKFHANGVKVQTHVLSGLPGETYKGHLNTLRKCFEFDFDDIQVFSTLLFSGSEMETQDSLSAYKIKTKYRLRQGSFGEYDDFKSIESEEIIRPTSTITEEEMLSLRPLHWLIWFGWNHGFLKPALRFAHSEHGINPLDVMIEIVEKCHESHPKISELFSDFCKEAEGEWFESREELQKFYFQSENWNALFSQGFSKAEFKYNSLLILQKDLYEDMLKFTHEILKGFDSSIEVEFLFSLMKKMSLHPDLFFNGSIVDEKKYISIPGHLAKYVLDLGAAKSDHQGEEVTLELSKPIADEKRVHSELSRYNYSKNKLYAVEKTLGAISDAFIYKKRLTTSPHILSIEPSLVEIS